jgi:hypothetical protein
MSDVWHDFEEGNQKGPITETELAALFESRNLTATTLAWKKGLHECVEAKKINVFSSSLHKPQRQFCQDNKVTDAAQARPWINFLHVKKRSLQKLTARILIITAVISTFYACQLHKKSETDEADQRRIYNNSAMRLKSSQDEMKINEGLSSLRQAYIKYFMAANGPPQKIEDLIPLYIKTLPDANGGYWGYAPETGPFWRRGGIEHNVRTYPIRNGWKNGGIYKAGADMPAGEYLLMSTSTVAYSYYAIMKKQSLVHYSTSDNIITNDVFLGSRYITVEDGRYFLLVNAQMIDVDKGPVLQPVNGKYLAGMYKVGRDIPRGKYKIIPGNANDSIIEITSNSSGLTKAIITSDHVTNERDITFIDGQYIKLIGCYLNVDTAGTVKLP